MKVIKFNHKISKLPIKVFFSLEKIIQQFEEYAEEHDSPYHASSKRIVEQVNKFPKLREGFENLEEIEKYEEEIKLLLRPLFPDPLQSNEIKSILMPFTFEGFNPTDRFAKILENAGEGFQLKWTNFSDDIAYIYACSFILAVCYQKTLFFGRPLYLDIPNKETGEMRHYRALINGDFLEIVKTENAPEITDEDFDELIRNSDNIEMWKKKFPPESYNVKGFGLVSLYDATKDVIINEIRSLFLRNDDKVFSEFRSLLERLMNIKELFIGYSIYDLQLEHSLGKFFSKGSNSLFLKENECINYHELFCNGIKSCVMEDVELLAISDIETYGKRTGKNELYRRLKQKNIQSLILVPIKIGDKYLQIIEVASTKKNELNGLNADALHDVIPYVKIASQRYLKESTNVVESTIQENYTSIHPAVKWRFDQAAVAFNLQKSEGIENPILEEISFDNIYPLYAQSDIKGSSTARNQAIQDDLETQLNLVIKTFEKILAIQDFPIYKKLIFRVKSYLNNVKSGLDAGDETTILGFLKSEIYPVFNHLISVNEKFEAAIAAYMAEIDSNMHVVYRRRKAYDDSVELLNEKMANYLDGRQDGAQSMFPHYFQRYKTDGVEYNIYIGDSLVEDQKFNMIYLQNLRLWQLETMWGLEQVAHQLYKEMPYPLQVASLILVHSHPLSIKFHMDQKAFDVDGAYNARYEIVKKRIDKSHIKGTNERLTQPGKLAIVYSQDSDAEEYLEYLKYWQSEGLFGKIEMVELEDLQGVSGLRALRAEVLYNEQLKLNSEELTLEEAEIVA